jgi:hypothetical protein
MVWDSSVVSEAGLAEEKNRSDAVGKPKVWGVHGGFSLVGNGNVTNSRCGTFGSYWGCLRVELHDKITLDGHNHKGKVHVQKVFNSCDKPSCPLCYKMGWAVREAGKIEARLKEGSKRFGEVQHIIVALPPKYWGLTYEDLRKLCLTVLLSRGVVGGATIFHGFRYNNAEEARQKGVRMGWYWSPHFHVLGFILGGYGRCRACAHCRRGCGGFVDRNYRLNEKDGCYVKVKGKRKTVGGTAWYQLNHATLRTDVKRPHVVTWFGVCSYRKLKVSPELRRRFCPICQHELERLRYFGSKDWFSGEFEKKSKFEADYCEDGRPVWFVEIRFKGYGG